MEFQIPGGRYLVVADTVSAQIPGGAYNSGAQRVLTVLLHENALGETGISGAVFYAPTSGAITGAKIGEFNNMAFGDQTENGFAVLRVPISNFNGEALSPTDSVVALVRNDINTSGIVPAAIVDE